MSTRDELAKLLYDEGAFCGVCSYESYVTCKDCRDVTTGYAKAVLAAGYRKPRTITTAEELDALPVGSVIRTSGHEDHFDPRVAVKTGFWLRESEWEVADADDFCLDSEELDDLPATVLYEPEPQP